jgi:hypothetical protein
MVQLVITMLTDYGDNVSNKAGIGSLHYQLKMPVSKITKKCNTSTSHENAAIRGFMSNAS